MSSVLRASFIAQLAWAAMAGAYNLASLFAIWRSGTGLAGDLPTTSRAMLAVVVFAGVTLLGMAGRLRLYRWLLPLVSIALLLGGVIKHLLASPAIYASHAVWLMAIGINVFGVSAYLMGVVAVYRPTVTGPESP